MRPASGAASAARLAVLALALALVGFAGGPNTAGLLDFVTFDGIAIARPGVLPECGAREPGKNAVLTPSGTDVDPVFRQESTPLAARRDLALALRPPQSFCRHEVDARERAERCARGHRNARGNFPAALMVQVSAMAKADPSGDRALIEALLRGDADAVEALVDRYGGWIHRVALRLLDDPRDAEEVTQDVLMTVVRKIGGFRREAAFSSWLYRVAANAAYERLRSRRARAEVSLEPLLPVFDEEGRHASPVVDWSGRLEDPAETQETRSALERGIARLSAEDRVALTLRDIEGLTNEEVAETLGLSVPALKSRLHRARLFLRRELEQVFTASG